MVTVLLGRGTGVKGGRGRDGGGERGEGKCGKEEEKLKQRA